MRRIAVSLTIVLLGISSINVLAQKPGRDSNSPLGQMLDTKSAGEEGFKHTIITPHLKQSIPKGTNVLWCNTFQLAWNELCDLAGGPIKMEDAPDMVSVLNRREASKKDLDKENYVALAGLASEGIFERIEKELLHKFKGQADSRLFEHVRKQEMMEWVTYAYLFKKMPFQWAFTRYHNNLNFEGKTVDWFGIDQFLKVQKDEAKMATQVAILDYQDSDDFIIELKTLAKNDRLILAKLSPKQTLGKTIEAVEGRIAGKKPTYMQEMADLRVPVLDFHLFREYRELYGKIIHTKHPKLGDTSIVIAAQRIRFRLDETGTILESEGIGAGGGVPANLIFDKPFLVLLKRRDAKRPYFALWVGNAELLVSTQDSENSPASGCTAIGSKEK